MVGTVAQLIIGAAIGAQFLGTDGGWIKFLSSIGAVLLTFLAGVELDPDELKRNWKQASTLGLVGFATPFLGCAAAAYFLLHWSAQASLLTGIALSTTSVAVVYAVLLELGFNRVSYGKGILAACFVNDLATVIGLGLLFAPFTIRTLIFVGVSIVVLAILPWLVPRFFKRYGNRPSELETKFLLLALFALGALASWAGSELVLPAYIVGMILAGTVGKDHALVRRLRTLTLGLLTPFYFIRAGSFVSLPALIAAPWAFVLLLFTKMATKFGGIFPITKAFKQPPREAMYTTLMMSTGLTFGSISALYGLTHHIVNKAQYSYLIAAVVASAVVPTMIANAFFMPCHLLPKDEIVARTGTTTSTETGA